MRDRIKYVRYEKFLEIWLSIKDSYLLNYGYHYDPQPPLEMRFFDANRQTIYRYYLAGIKTND